MRSLQCRDNAFKLTDKPEADECFSIGSSNELCALIVFPGGEFGTDARVVEPSGYGVCVLDLAVLVLEDVGADTMQHTFGAARKGSAVALSINAITAGFNAEELNGGVFGEGVKHADCVATASYASYDRIGEFSALLEHLGTGLVTDDRLESSDNCWEGVRADG